MVVYKIFSSLRRCLDGRRQQFFLPSRRAFRLQAQWPILAGCVLLASAVLTSCSGLNLGGSASPSPTGKAVTPTSTTTALARLHWCDKPLMVFRDLAASGTPGVKAGNPTTITDWSVVEPRLGFTVYLPATLPTGSCLVSASGTVRDPILGSNFVIGYILPDHSSITLSQAPQRTQSTAFQCSLVPSTSGTKATPTPTTSQGPTQFCSGARGSTNIVFSSSGKTAALQQFFNALQPGVDWVPTA
jgi:hypothetical protein